MLKYELLHKIGELAREAEKNPETEALAASLFVLAGAGKEDMDLPLMLVTCNFAKKMVNLAKAAPNSSGRLPS